MSALLVDEKGSVLLIMVSDAGTPVLSLEMLANIQFEILQEHCGIEPSTNCNR